MAQRTLDSSFWDDEDVANLSMAERLLLICMFTDVSLSDDFGCLPANPKTLRKHAFGYDDDVTSGQVAGWRDNILAKCSNVILYQVDGQEYIFLKKFEQWQQLRYHRKSNTPKPQGHTFPTDDILDERIPDQPEPEPTPAPLQEIAESSRNVSQDSEKFPLCSVELNRDELGREGLGCVPTARIALPAAITPPTAPNISLPDAIPKVVPDFKALGHEAQLEKRTSSRMPKLPAMPVGNDGLSQPEIDKIMANAFGLYSELLPKNTFPTDKDRDMIQTWGKLWGYAHVRRLFLGAARGKLPYKTLAQIHDHLGDTIEGDNGNGQPEPIGEEAG